MAANPTPTQVAKLIARSHDLAFACANYGEDIGLKINTGEVMHAALNEATAALAQVRSLTGLRGKRRADFRKADAAVKRTLGHCRLRLVMFYGQAFNVHWDAAGFPDNSTQVPESQAQRSSLLAQLALWFKANPTLESGDMQATAAISESVHDAYQTARSAVLSSKTELCQAVQQKDAALNRLRDRYRSLISELTVLLSTDDPRWQLFGLNLPAQPSAPRPVPIAQFEWLPQGGLSVSWQRGAHATRYRVQARHAGETDFTHVVTRHNLEAHLPELTPEPGLELQIIAANEVSESAPYIVNLAPV